MSIINKMLQELEQRQAEESDARVLPGQLKAAPQARGRHAGWLAAAVLAAMLVCVLAWLWLKPVAVPAPAPAVVSAKPADAQQMPPQLALKIESTMPMAEQAPDAQQMQQTTSIVETPMQPAAEEQQAKAEKTEKKPADKTEPAVVPEVAPATPADAAGAQGADKMARPQPARREVKEYSEERSAPSQARTSPKPATPLQQQSSAQQVQTQQAQTQQTAADAPVVLDKQVRPLTPQQRAENDYRRAVAMAEQGRAAEATALLEQVLQEVPAHAGARQTLIALLLKTGRQDEAMRRAKEGLDLDVRQPGLAMILARLQVEKGAQQAAITTLQNSLPYAADQPDYRAFLAALLQREGRQKEAIEQYLLAVRAVPQNGIWWMGLGISLQADGRMEEAREAFSRARETGSLSPELRAFVEQKLKQLH